MNEGENMTTVSKLLIMTLVGYFLLYIVGHIFIGMTKKYLDKNLLKKPNDKELKKQTKIINHLFNWFPAVYLIFILMVLYQ